jgi:hypothetical protein
MAFKGRRMKMHGAFASKSDAKKKEGQGSGRYILERTIRGKKRYIVLSKA